MQKNVSFSKCESTIRIMFMFICIMHMHIHISAFNAIGVINAQTMEFAVTCCYWLLLFYVYFFHFSIYHSNPCAATLVYSMRITGRDSGFFSCSFSLFPFLLKEEKQDTKRMFDIIFNTLFTLFDKQFQCRKIMLFSYFSWNMNRISYFLLRREKRYESFHFYCHYNALHFRWSTMRW